STARCQAGEGCVTIPLEGVAGLTCLCSQGLVPAECSQVPARVASRLRRTCRLADRASAKNVKARRIRALAQQISQTLGRAVRSATAAASRGTLDDSCVAALTERLADARGPAHRRR